MFKKKAEDKLSQYEDPIGGFSSRDLRLATWYVKHKEQLRAVGIACLVIFDIALITFGFWGWAEYAIIGYRQDRQMLANQIFEVENYAAQQARYGARELQFGTTAVYQSGTDRYDFVVDVENSNTRWVADITYQFSYNGGVTDEQTMTLMPGARQPLVVFGVESVGTPSALRFQPLSISWRSIDPHIVPDPAAYLTKRNVFVPGDVSFFFANDADTGGHRIMFSVLNNSVFSYWEPQFIVELRDGDIRQGLLLVTLDEFRAGEIRTVDLQSFATNLFVSDIVLHPLIHFFDANEYME